MGLCSAYKSGSVCHLRPEQQLWKGLGGESQSRFSKPWHGRCTFGKSAPHSPRRSPFLAAFSTPPHPALTCSPAAHLLLTCCSPGDSPLTHWSLDTIESLLALQNGCLPAAGVSQSTAVVHRMTFTTLPPTMDPSSVSTCCVADHLYCISNEPPDPVDTHRHRSRRVAITEPVLAQSLSYSPWAERPRRKKSS